MTARHWLSRTSRSLLMNPLLIMCILLVLQVLGASLLGGWLTVTALVLGILWLPLSVIGICAGESLARMIPEGDSLDEDDANRPHPGYESGPALPDAEIVYQAGIPVQKVPARGSPENMDCNSRSGKLCALYSVCNESDCVCPGPGWVWRRVEADPLTERKPL